MYIPVDSKILKLVKRIMNLIKKEKIKIRISGNYLIIFTPYMITKTYYFTTDGFKNNFKGKDFEIVKVDEKERKLILEEIERTKIEEIINDFLKEGKKKYFQKWKSKNNLEEVLIASYELANKECILNLDFLKIFNEFYEGSYVITFLNEAYIITNDTSNLNNDNYLINTYTIIAPKKFKEFKEDYNLGNFKFKKEVFELC